MLITLMMEFLARLNPYLILRLSLGISYLYSGSDMLRFPHKWYGFIPPWFSQGLYRYRFTPDGFLALQGLIEITAGLIFLVWALDRFGWGRWIFRLTCIAVALQMFLILLFTGIDPITFRDITILGAALAILIMSLKKYGTSQ